MTKPDELDLMRRVLVAGRLVDGAGDMVECSKRGLYILAKWVRRGWWDCGVSLRSGWLTPKGAAEMLADARLRDVLRAWRDDERVQVEVRTRIAALLIGEAGTREQP